MVVLRPGQVRLKFWIVGNLRSDQPVAQFAPDLGALVEVLELVAMGGTAMKLLDAEPLGQDDLWRSARLAKRMGETSRLPRLRKVVRT